MKFKVELARLVRETRVVVVEAASEDDLCMRLGEVYRLDDDLGFWEEDAMLGADEGTHSIIGLDDDSYPYDLITLPQKE
jgi:hypothetical protein